MSADAPQERPENTTETGTDSRVSLRAWTQQMDAYTGPDTLLEFNRVDNVCIDLAEANSSGQAQLLMGRPTRLSTMIHHQDPAYERAARSARALRTKIHELSVMHGLDAAYLAAGTASWLTNPAVDGQRRFIAPVLLAPVTVKLRPDGKDFELQIVAPARLNPALVRRLREDYDVELATGEMSRLAYGTRRLDPAPVLETLRQLAVDVPGMHVDHQLLVSTFADLHERPADENVEARTQFVRGLARLKNHEVGKLPTVTPLENRAEPLDLRDPAHELALTDLDRSQQEVVDLAEQGESFVVSTPVGTPAIDTVVATVGSLVYNNKSVLVLGESRTTLSAFTRAWNRLGLDSLVLPLGSHLNDDDIAERLVRASPATNGPRNRISNSFRTPEGLARATARPRGIAARRAPALAGLALSSDAGPGRTDRSRTRTADGGSVPAVRARRRVPPLRGREAVGTCRTFGRLRRRDPGRALEWRSLGQRRRGTRSSPARQVAAARTDHPQDRDP
ncbi:DUF4011 domain-containing protein [Kocuria atrinae]|uniref:DUF4011 domain-containing protein n=1 Tax=Kocuria atrinae TaxID=592377 RepID=UPI0002D288CB|nr:DUF4011 domain-containing protein [Kocuria atrinae]